MIGIASNLSSGAIIIAGSKLVSVLVPRPVPEPFDYLLPDQMSVQAGDFVEVPLGSELVVGLVLKVFAVDADGAAEVNERRLRPICSVLEQAPRVSEGGLAFLLRAARYVVAPPGALLKMMMRHHGGMLPPLVDLVFRGSAPLPERMSLARQAVLEAHERAGPCPAAELARLAKVSPSVVSTLINIGVLARERRIFERVLPSPDPLHKHGTLTPEQERAADCLRKAVRKREFTAILLDGVTGSGKTEVYFEAVAEALLSDSAAQILILLPEIALTEALIERFRARFGAEPAQWHSGISPGRKRGYWREIACGRARIIIGARSALFLPFAGLRLIIVDEEHDVSYKQEEGIALQARDLAVMRAQCEEAIIVLVSATPSLESLANVASGRYLSVHLKGRPGVARLPEIELIDMRRHSPCSGSWLSAPLVAAMEETLAGSGQVLLFLNRRGYAPLVLCRNCGERMRSPETDSWLSEHRHSGRLICHLTGFSMPRPKACPHCHAVNSLIGVGPGVERIAEEARSRFATARLAVFSSDTTPSAEAARTLVTDMASGEIDILVGTQLVAKGHNFPGLALVGVVDADCSLQGGDLRASERTWQLLLQVTGRAGRAQLPGRAMIQTYAPETPALAALDRGDRDSFIAMEMQARRALQMPPFGRLCALIVSADSAAKADAAARELAKAAPNGEGVDLWGPAPAPIAVIRGRHRRRFLARCGRETDLSSYMRTWRQRASVPTSVRVMLDMDPYSFM